MCCNSGGRSNVSNSPNACHAHHDCIHAWHRHRLLAGPQHLWEAAVDRVLVLRTSKIQWVTQKLNDKLRQSANDPCLPRPTPHTDTGYVCVSSATTFRSQCVVVSCTFLQKRFLQAFNQLNSSLHMSPSLGVGLVWRTLDNASSLVSHSASRTWLPQLSSEGVS